MMTVVTGGARKSGGKSAFCRRIKIVSFASRQKESILQPCIHMTRKVISVWHVIRKCVQEKDSRRLEIVIPDLKNLDFPENAVVLLECMSNLAANEMFEEKGAGEKNCGSRFGRHKKVEKPGTSSGNCHQ